MTEVYFAGRQLSRTKQSRLAMRPVNVLGSVLLRFVDGFAEDHRSLALFGVKHEGFDEAGLREALAKVGLGDQPRMKAN